MALNQQAVAHQMLHGLAHRDTGDLDLGGKVTLGGKRIAGLDGATRYRVFDPAFQLQIERTTLRQDDGFGAEKLAGQIVCPGPNHRANRPDAGVVPHSSHNTNKRPLTKRFLR